MKKWILSLIIFALGTLIFIQSAAKKNLFFLILGGIFIILSVVLSILSLLKKEIKSWIFLIFLIQIIGITFSIRILILAIMGGSFFPTEPLPTELKLIPELFLSILN